MFRSFSIAIAVLSSLILGSIRFACACDEEIDAKQLRKAIERGIAFLKSKQDPDQGTWPDHGGQNGGVAALCTLALLNSGVPVEHPVLKRSLTYSRCWALSGLADAKTTAPAVAPRIAAAKSIGLNIVAYAADRKLRTRDEFLTSK
jgi:hypothetical protein